MRYEKSGNQRYYKPNVISSRYFLQNCKNIEVVLQERLVNADISKGDKMTEL